MRRLTRPLVGLAVALASVSAPAAEHNWKMQTEWGGGPLMDSAPRPLPRRSSS